MKNQIVDIFAELGRRMGAFGDDARTQSVAEQAVALNPWFTLHDIAMAAKSLSAGMLSESALHEWLSAYPLLPVADSHNVLVVMAGNIPFVGFQDLQSVLAAGHRALVKYSSKDRVLMSYIVDELLSIEPSLPVSEYTDGIIPNAVIAMGGNNAVRALHSRYANIPALLRGNRSSLAVLSGGETLRQLDGLAGDILSYSGLGCRNVSLIFIPEDFDLSRLKDALLNRASHVNPKYLSNYRQTKAMLSVTGVNHIDCGFCVLCEDAGFPSALSRVNYVRYSSDDQVGTWIAAHADEVQCVAGDAALGRTVALGMTQTPGLLDYPDGRDTMEFLSQV